MMTFDGFKYHFADRRARGAKNVKYYLHCNQFKHKLRKNMKTNQTIILITIVILGLLFNLQQAAALGIQPAKTTVSIEDNPSYSGKFWIMNNDHQELNLHLSVEALVEILHHLKR